METSRSPRSRRAGRVLVRVVFLACRQLPSSYVLTWPLLCACKESILVSLLIRTPRVRCRVRGPTLITSLNFNYLLEGSVEKEMATHSSILAWRILWMEEPGGLWSVRSQSRTWLKGLSTHIRSCITNALRMNLGSWRALTESFSLTIHLRNSAFTW